MAASGHAVCRHESSALGCAAAQQRASDQQAVVPLPGSCSSARDWLWCMPCRCAAPVNRCPEAMGTTRQRSGGAAREHKSRRRGARQHSTKTRRAVAKTRHPDLSCRKSIGRHGRSSSRPSAGGGGRAARGAAGAGCCAGRVCARLAHRAAQPQRAAPHQRRDVVEGPRKWARRHAVRRRPQAAEWARCVLVACSAHAQQP